MITPFFRNFFCTKVLLGQLVVVGPVSVPVVPVVPVWVEPRTGPAFVFQVWLGPASVEQTLVDPVPAFQVLVGLV